MSFLFKVVGPITKGADKQQFMVYLFLLILLLFQVWLKSHLLLHASTIIHSMDKMMYDMNHTLNCRYETK